MLDLKVKLYEFAAFSTRLSGPEPRAATVIARSTAAGQLGIELRAAR
jgi:hypothetical protein